MDSSMQTKIEATNRQRLRNVFCAIVFLQLLILVAYIARGVKRGATMGDSSITNQHTPVKNDSGKKINLNGTSQSILKKPKPTISFRRKAAPITSGLPNTTCGYLVRAPFEGRLGNEMFMYASFYGIVKKQRESNKTSFLWSGPGQSLLSAFEKLSLPKKVLPGLWFDQRGFTWIWENKCCGYDGNGIENLKCDGKNIILRGFRQSYKYFAEVMNEVKKEFTFNKAVKAKCLKQIDAKFAENGFNKAQCVSVGVHLRRGDLTNQPEMQIGYLPAQLDYLNRAIRFFEMIYFGANSNYSNDGLNNHSCLVFLIFGDDYAWNLNATEQITLLRPSDTHFILFDRKKSEPAVDLCTMSLCDHMIISVGTFSWWAGFMNRGIVIYQKEFAKPGSSIYNQFVQEDYFLPHWIAL